MNYLGLTGEQAETYDREVEKPLRQHLTEYRTKVAVCMLPDTIVTRGACSLA